MTINQSYTREQAMKRLGIKSMKQFRSFERRHAEMFVNVNLGVNRDSQPLYDKSALDKFANIRDKLHTSEPEWVPNGAKSKSTKYSFLMLVGGTRAVPSLTIDQELFDNIIATFQLNPWSNELRPCM